MTGELWISLTLIALLQLALALLSEWIGYRRGFRAARQGTKS